MKKEIKKMSESEMMMVKAVIDFHPFARDSVLINKGDMKAPDWSTLLDWEDSFPDWEEDEGIMPQKNMKRQERRKYRFHKDKGRQTRARDLGYNLSPNMTSGKVKTLLSANHMDRMCFRGAKAKKKLGKAMTTKEAKNLMAQIELAAEQDRLAEYKEAERQFALDELASTEDDLERLTFMENEMKKAISDLVRTVYEANEKLVDFQAKVNGLQAAERILRNKIAELEEVVNS